MVCLKTKNSLSLSLSLSLSPTLSLSLCHCVLFVLVSQAAIFSSCFLISHRGGSVATVSNDLYAALASIARVESTESKYTLVNVTFKVPFLNGLM